MPTCPIFAGLVTYNKLFTVNKRNNWSLIFSVLIKIITYSTARYKIIVISTYSKLRLTTIYLLSAATVKLDASTEDATDTFNSM